MSKPEVNVLVGGPINGVAPCQYKTKILKANLSFKGQVENDPNTKFVIKWDFDLGGEEITIPENCVLKFDGGSVSNGKCVSNGTRLLNYDGDGSELFGQFYDIEGNRLNYSGKKIVGDKSAECFILRTPNDFIEDTLNFQSFVTTADYFFLFGYVYPQSEKKSFIAVYDKDWKLVKYLKHTPDPNNTHYNDATLCGDYIYLANGAYICRYLISNILESNEPTQEIVLDIQADRVDYDAVNDEFLVIRYDQTCIRYTRDFQEIDSYQFDIDAIIAAKYHSTWVQNSVWYKNGIAHMILTLDHVQNGAVGQYVHLIVDCIGKKVVDIYSITSMRANVNIAVQGACKDPEDDNVVWIAPIYDLTSAVAAYILTKYSESEEVIGNSGYAPMVTDYIKPQNATIYVNNQYSGQSTEEEQRIYGAYSDGSQKKPFRTFDEAYLIRRNATIHIAASETPYNIGFVYVDGGSLEIIGDGKANTTIRGCIIVRNGNVIVRNVKWDIDNSVKYNNGVVYGLNSYLFMQLIHFKSSSAANLLTQSSYNANITFDGTDFDGVGTIAISHTTVTLMGIITAPDYPNTRFLFRGDTQASQMFIASRNAIPDTSGLKFAEKFGSLSISYTIFNSDDLAKLPILINSAQRYQYKIGIPNDLEVNEKFYPSGAYTIFGGSLKPLTTLELTTAQRGKTLLLWGKGRIVYDTDLKKMVLYNGSAWVNVDGTPLVVE